VTGGIGRVVSQLAEVAGRVAAVLIVGIAVLVTVGVVAAAGFSNPLIGIFEFSGYALLAATFLSAPLLARDDAHVRLDLLDSLLPPRWQARTDLFSGVFQALVAAACTAAGLWVIVGDVASGVPTAGFAPIPRWIPLSVIPVGSGLLLAVTLIRLRRRPSGGHD